MADIEQRVPDAAATTPTDELPEEPATVIKPRAPPSTSKAAATEAKDQAGSGRRKKDERADASGAAKLDATVTASGPRLPVHLLTGELRRVVLWEDSVKSSSWLAGLSAATYFLFFHHGSLLSVGAYALLAATLANLVYVNAYAAYCNFKHQAYEHPNRRTLERGGLVVLNKEWLLERIGQAVDEANRQLSVLSRIVYCEDNLTSFKAAGALYAVAVATNWLSPGALAVLLLLMVFVLPILYLKFHPVVDQVLATVEQHVTKLVHTATEKAKQLLRHVPFLKIKLE